jgi:hypothetical protein
MISSNPARAGLGAFALVAALATSCAPALAEHGRELTLRTAAGTLAPGAILATPGGSLTISTQKGDVVCPSTELRGSLDSNGLPVDAFGSSIETGPFLCTSEWPTGFGERAEVQFLGHQEGLITAKGKGTIEPAGEAAIGVDVNFPEAPSCEYAVARFPFKFSAGAAGHPQPVTMLVKGLLKPVGSLPKGCGKMQVRFSATLALQAERAPASSGEYEAVESEAG